MTAQVAENLNYEGEELSMCTNPLSTYFAMGGAQPKFESNCTALWRGYVGTWEIVDDRLYLIGLTGTIEGGAEVNLATVFPDYPDRVFAHWYTGTIRLPRGKMLEYVHMGYGSTYEEDVLLKIAKGVVVVKSIQTNGKSDSDDAPEGYGIGGMTVLPSKTSGGDRDA